MLVSRFVREELLPAVAGWGEISAERRFKKKLFDLGGERVLARVPMGIS